MIGPSFDNYWNTRADYITLDNILNNKIPIQQSDNNQISIQQSDNNEIIMIGGSKSSVKKWSTLVHHGVMFYPEYEPHEIPIKYGSNKLIVHLNPEAEEFITYYVHSKFDKYRSDKFNKNFFGDWKKLLTPELRKQITDFNLCDLSEIKQYIEKEGERKKIERGALSKENKEDDKKENDKKKEKYQYAIVDGSKQMIDNFLVEPPTIFVGRGSHPLTGSIKHRIYPQDITLNIGPNMEIPVPELKNIGETETTTVRERWGAIISDNKLEWIASWQNNVTQKYNYARFGRKSKFKMQSDERKYDLARLLKKKIKKIREKNEANMKSSDMETKQLATALFLIDRLALRIGNEKKEDEADTVGVTTLKIKNVSLMDNHMIKLDFLGKDSIRYVNKFKVPEIVYDNIKEFHADPKKTSNDELFDLVQADALNKYIKQFMKKLTSKVFRTYNASFLMQNELKKITTKYKDYDKSDKLQKLHHEYEMVNLKVAKLCNHQKVASKTSGAQLEKTHEKITELTHKLNKLKREKDKKISDGKTTSGINKKILSLQQKIKNLKNKKTLQSESKTLSSGTSKTNYIDPRITISFLKINGIFDGIDKFFSKTHQNQFTWAMEIEESFKF